MTTQPHPLTHTEWNEIGTFDTIRESRGVEDGESFADFAADNIYGVKFNFHSGSPGYVGDLYILQGDTLMAIRLSCSSGIDPENSLSPIRLKKVREWGAINVLRPDWNFSFVDLSIFDRRDFSRPCTEWRTWRAVDHEL
jgi:hypothetical protein